MTTDIDALIALGDGITDAYQRGDAVSARAIAAVPQLIAALRELRDERDALRKALAEIHDLVQRRQLPITNAVFEIADAALYGDSHD